LDKAKFLMRMNEILELEPGTLQGHEALDELDGWDSMAMVEFQAFADAELGIELDARRIQGCETVGELMQLVAAKAA